MYCRIKKTWDYPKYSCPRKKGPRYFYYYNTGLQNQRFVWKTDNESVTCEKIQESGAQSYGTVTIEFHVVCEQAFSNGADPLRPQDVVRKCT